MMAALKTGVIEVPVSGSIRSMVMRVRATGVRRFRARLWLGGQIIRFAAWVIGMRGEVEIEIKGDE